jgi:hypothetical protein
MLTLLAIAVPVAIIGAFEVLVVKFGAEDRPGFNERVPLA